MNATLRPVLCALLVALPLLAQAASDNSLHTPDVVSTERGIETSSGLLVLPTSVPGSMTVNQCINCKSQTLAVNAQTRFFLGTAQVSLADFRARLAGAPPTFIMVFADRVQPVALRVVINVAPAAPVRPR